MINKAAPQQTGGFIVVVYLITAHITRVAPGTIIHPVTALCNHNTNVYTP